MNYHVHWTAEAHDRLERMWMAAADPRVILKAANTIDDRLGEDPWASDVVLSSEMTFIIEPLAVDFNIDSARRKVLILRVWMIGFLDDEGE